MTEGARMIDLERVARAACLAPAKERDLCPCTDRCLAPSVHPYKITEARAAALDVIEQLIPHGVGDLPEEACLAGENAGATSYTDATLIFKAMMEAIKSELERDRP